ncbi:MAG TPA: formate dehydrogenase [Spirochaetota bacterium]|nr:formate dehydrogenase [Spirochaetota bacterium]HPF04561.1 formate dehydrogenase [Spirochaetota bacterium]HPJ41994.1 formate dehydrogenase [Spirochaetota bacterium]HPR37672.1 formate dehydrogenase [Spirochaetota bacterium]HRX46086.1 formate dehydrogenase [Spirochaetota bacterium]
MAKTFFIDTSRCTACRGCQVACKEWQGFEANYTKQLGWGSHQNPQDLNPLNFKLVRFNEFKDKDRVIWNFFPDQCRHCTEPPCKLAADAHVKGAVVVDKATGAVIFTEKTKKISKEGFLMMKEYCPYDIPRRNEKTGIINKCDMCLERVEEGLVPMCVKTCPTGAMNFGDRDKMLAMAYERLAIVKKEFPEASLLDVDSVRVIYLITHKRDTYHNLAMLDEHSKTGALA